MDFSINHNSDCRVFNETAYALQSHGVPPAGRHEGVLLSDGNRLLSIKQKKPSTPVCRYCHLWIVCLCEIPIYKHHNTGYLHQDCEAFQVVKWQKQHHPNTRSWTNYWIQLDTILRSNSFTSLLRWGQHRLETLHVWPSRSVCFSFNSHLCQQGPLDFLRYPTERCQWCRSFLSTWRRGLSAHLQHGESPLCVWREIFGKFKRATFILLTINWLACDRGLY